MDFCPPERDRPLRGLIGLGRKYLTSPAVQIELIEGVVSKIGGPRLNVRIPVYDWHWLEGWVNSYSGSDRCCSEKLTLGARSLNTRGDGS